MTKPDTQRKAEERARKKRAGLSRGEYWAPKELHDRIKHLIAKFIETNQTKGKP